MAWVAELLLEVLDSVPRPLRLVAVPVLEVEEASGYPRICEAPLPPSEDQPAWEVDLAWEDPAALAM